MDDTTRRPIPRRRRKPIRSRIALAVTTVAATATTTASIALANEPGFRLAGPRLVDGQAPSLDAPVAPPAPIVVIVHRTIHRVSGAGSVAVPASRATTSRVTPWRRATNGAGTAVAPPSAAPVAVGPVPTPQTTPPPTTVAPPPVTTSTHGSKP